MNGTETQLNKSQKTMLVQGALSTTLFSIGTGNFLAGYLTYLGAEPAFCAVVAAMPQLGCIMQLVSPFFFERMRNRKLLIIVCCFIFRIGMGLAGLIPFMLSGKNAKLGAVCVLYLLAFLMAGFVTPGLDRWTMTLAPSYRRGRFFAIKNIVSAVISSGISLSLGWQLDYFSSKGTAGVGYLILYGCCCILACVDMLLLRNMDDCPCEPLHGLKIHDLARPMRDKTYRNIMMFLPVWFFALNFSNTFLSVYMLRGLGLSHTAITGIATIASAAGIVGTWYWGQRADKTSWNTILTRTGCIIAATYICWSFVRPEWGIVIPLVLQAAVAACSGSFNVANQNLQFSCSPREGKTLYIGVGAAISNLAGYAAALIGASAQSALMQILGIRSICVLFACTGILCLVAVLVFVPRLPRIIPGQEERETE
ncbi:MAG: MFS transporter [Oscillospiraceae bacterium]|nr:MFS transporter [Oscillospiraceae bacterium]